MQVSTLLAQSISYAGLCLSEFARPLYPAIRCVYEWHIYRVKTPNSITLTGSKLVRSCSQTCSELKFGLSSSLLAANKHELAGPRPASNLSATSFEPDSVMEFVLKWVESVRSRPLSYGHIMSFIRANRRRTPVWPTASNSRAGCSEPAVY